MKLPPRNRVKVPDMVKYHYKKPVKLLPSLKDVLRVEYVMSRNKDAIKTDHIDIDEIKLEDDNVGNDGNNQMNGENINTDRINNCNFNQTNKCVVLNGIVENDDCKISVDEQIKNETQFNEAQEVNNCVKNEGLNGAYYSQDLIKKENSFLADFIAGITCEGKNQRKHCKVNFP